jgi:hypothetical protein
MAFTVEIVLTNREKVIVLITDAITSYSRKMEENIIPKNQSVVDYVLKSIPEDLKSEISIALIEDVFSQISN